jgi:hypothetical protein
MDSPKLQKKGLGAIASSLNYIGGTIGNALEVSFCENLFPNTIEFLMFHIFCLQWSKFLLLWHFLWHSCYYGYYGISYNRL